MPFTLFSFDQDKILTRCNCNTAHDGVTIEYTRTFTEAAAVVSIQLFTVRSLQALQQLNNNPALNHVDVNVNGSITRITRANRGQFVRAMTILHPVFVHLQGGLHLQRRGLYYYYCHHFGKGADTQFSRDLKHISSAIRTPLRSLNIRDRPNSYGFGQVKITIIYSNKSPTIIDLSSASIGTLLSDEPICADQKLDDIVDIQVSVNDEHTITRIIVVEKHSVLVPMIEAGWNETMKAILLCPGGFPSKNDKAWVRFFIDKLGINVEQCGVIHDYNPHGFALGNSYQLNNFPGYEKYSVQLPIAGVTSALLDNFPKVIGEVKLSGKHSFKKADLDMMKHLLKPETKFYKESNDKRFIELARLYDGNFKLDIDALIFEYGAEYVLGVFELVITTNNQL